MLHHSPTRSRLRAIGHGMRSKLSLEELVTSAATDLMGVTAVGLRAAAQDLLEQLVEYFGVDLSFLRRNDHSIGATILVAEWPPRPDIPDPDPLGLVYFAKADPTFAATEHLSSVMITRPSAVDDADYQARVRQASGIVGGVSSATVPLLSAEGTMGVMGFIKYGDREWSDAEINALRAVAGLLAQLQARVDAEERLLYLAYHDELTDVANRRSLIDHLTERLQPDQPGPVGLIFMDVDRLVSGASRSAAEPRGVAAPGCQQARCTGRRFRSTGNRPRRARRRRGRSTRRGRCTGARAQRRAGVVDPTAIA